MNVRRVFAHIAFALVLLLSQQLGITHAISHLSADNSLSELKKKQLPKDLQCEQCLGFAALGAGLTGSPVAIAQFLLPAAAPVGTSFVEPLPPASRLFDSRAPPLRS